MEAENLDLGIMFLTQTGVGIFGNFFLLGFYNFSLLSGHNMRPTDLILNQLALANSLFLFSKGIPQTIVAFRWKYFLDDAGCKLIFYFHRVATGVSFSTVCLLNGFQAIKLNPSMCRWLGLKMGSLKFIGFCCSLCWVLHLSVNSFILVVVNGPLNNKNFTLNNNYGHCSWPWAEPKTVYATLHHLPDMVSLVLMTWASGSMVHFLHRHRQRVHHIHSQTYSSRLAHEAKATRTILILVISFVAFYSVYTILTLWMTTTASPGQWRVDSSVLVASCFPALSPFVLIVSDARLSVLLCLKKGKENFLSKYTSTTFVFSNTLSINTRDVLRKV